MREHYPSEAELERVASWDQGLREGFAFVRSLWWAPEWGWHEETVTVDGDKLVTRYRISTGGWSGNEDLVAAMQMNYMLWGMTWMQSRRGGHYIFELLQEGG